MESGGVLSWNTEGSACQLVVGPVLLLVLLGTVEYFFTASTVTTTRLSTNFTFTFSWDNVFGGGTGSDG